jgi:hypothetical protein
MLMGCDCVTLMGQPGLHRLLLDQQPRCNLEAGVHHMLRLCCYSPRVACSDDLLMLPWNTQNMGILTAAERLAGQLEQRVNFP